MRSGNLRFVLLHTCLVLLAVSAGCGASFGPPNDAVVNVENRGDAARTVQIRVGVENETVFSRNASVGPGDERLLNRSKVPVTESERQYRVRVSLEDGPSEVTSFVAGEFDSIQVVIGVDGAIEVHAVNAA